MWTLLVMQEFKVHLWRSLLLFWPKDHINFVAVLDNEKDADHALAIVLEQVFVDAGIKSYKVVLEVNPT